MKISHLVTATLFFGIVNAEYVVKVNLEDHKINFHNWIATTPIQSEFQKTGSIYNCSNWTPDAASITVNQLFNQTATDCKQEESRTVQNRELNTVSGEIRNNGTAYIENQTIIVNDTRNSIGTLKTWVDISPSYTEWTNSGSVKNCSNWSPATASINAGQSFTQTATNCQQDQTSLKQDREQETTTLEIRNKGIAVTDTKTITATSTRTEIGTKPTIECLPHSASSYLEMRDSGMLVIYWNNALISRAHNETPYNYNGYRYSEGAYAYGGDADEYGEIYNFTRYAVCRTPI